VLDLLVVTVAQGAIGYTQYFTGVPPLLVGLHVLGATLLWVMTLRLVLAAPEPVEAAMPVPAGAVVGSTP
jgi:cytochrome c oxidase assembly protein subunit 15